MPRYYLHVFNGMELIRDPDGSLFSDCGAARQEARETAIDLWCEVLRSRRDPRGYAIHIRDEQDELQGVVGFQDVMECLKP